MKKLMSFMAVTLLIVSVTGCSTNKQTPSPRIVQANLLQKQETDGTKLHQLSGTDGLAVTESMEYWRGKYFQCAIPYNGLIDVVTKQFPVEK